MELEMAKIRTDMGTQTRVTTSQDVVDEYAEAMLAGADFPAVDVFRTADRTHILADGFHRYFARRKAFPNPKATIRAVLHQGELRDAILFAVGTNVIHGFQRTPDDKRHAVGIMLRDKEWSQWSNRAIADRCGVGEKLVRICRALCVQNAGGQKLSSARKCERNGQTHIQGMPRPKPTPELESAKANAVADLKNAVEALCAFEEADFERRNIDRQIRRLEPDYEPGGETCSVCGQTLPAGGTAPE